MAVDAVLAMVRDMKYLACLCLLLPLLPACAGSPASRETAMLQAEFADVRVTDHRGQDDLLSAGLGQAGLAGPPSAFVDPLQPTASELRQRAIQTSWKGIADLGPLGGYGVVYGGVPAVPGREYHAFAHLPGTRTPHRVLLQLPDQFHQQRPCLLVAPSSGSRGIYGAIALAGAWGLPRGCAVAYTDKGTGSGYFDHADDSGVALDGRRRHRGQAMLEFEPPPVAGAAGIAVKHAHSGDNPEADWGRHVLQAARFGLAMLDRAYPAQAPFNARNTTIIAVGLSNGGGAVLQAAGLDDTHMLAGVVALEPNIHVDGDGRALYDYATEAAIWLPCALLDEQFKRTPFARGAGGTAPPAGVLRCASLHANGLVAGVTLEAQAQAAHRHLLAAGWSNGALEVAATTAAFDVWRAVAAGYASAYLRRDAAHMPCGFRYAADANPGLVDPALRASWWADASGIPPGNGIGLYGGTDATADSSLGALQCLRALWTGDSADAQTLHASVAATAARMPRADLPLWVVHGADDGLVPVAFSSEPYVAWLRAAGRRPLYWQIPHAQHFDAFLALPGFGERHVPLLPYGYAALDHLWAHLRGNQAWPTTMPTPAARPRGAGAIDAQTLGLP